jgi:hypothetical protein
MSRPHCDAEEPQLRPVAGANHVAACHYAEELAGDVRADEVFATAEADLKALEELEELGNLGTAEAAEQDRERT